MSILNAFQTVVPRAEPKDYQGKRRPGYVLGADGKFSAKLEWNKSVPVFTSPPLTLEQKIDRDIKSGSIRASESYAARRRASVRRPSSGVFTGI